MGASWCPSHKPPTYRFATTDMLISPDAQASAIVASSMVHPSSFLGSTSPDLKAYLRPSSAISRARFCWISSNAAKSRCLISFWLLVASVTSAPNFSGRRLQQDDSHLDLTICRGQKAGVKPSVLPDRANCLCAIDDTYPRALRKPPSLDYRR